MLPQQLSIINGSLLGDGSISKFRIRKVNSKINSCFSKKQSTTRRDYLDWHFDQLQPYSARVRDRLQPKPYMKDGQVKNDGVEMVSMTTFSTKSSLFFTGLRHHWYPEGKKTVPRDLVLDPLAVAIWYCDDGTHEPSSRVAKLSTESFSWGDCLFLVSELARLGIKCYVGKGRVGPIISTYAESYLDFIEMVRPFVIWDSFRYKVDLSRYTVPQFQKVKEDQAKEIFRLYETGMIYREIAEAVGLSIGRVSAVLRGQCWSELGLSKAVAGIPLRSISGIKGVGWDKSRNKWTAGIRVDGKWKNLGRFSSKEEAARYIKEWAS